MHNNLRASASSWFPNKGYQSPIKSDFPASYLDYSDGARFKEVAYELCRGGQRIPTAPKIGTEMDTYVPDSTLFAGLKLPAWGSQHGTRETRAAPAARDMIGHCLLIRVKRIATPEPIPGTLHTPMDETEHELSNLILDFYNDVYEFPDHKNNNFRYEWLFAYVMTYNSYTGKHELVLKFDDIPVTGNCVHLEKCMFQDWTHFDLETLKG